MGKRISALFCFGEDHELLGITGTLQVEDGVVHIVAEKPWRPTLELKPSGTATRDFHSEQFSS